MRSYTIAIVATSLAAMLFAAPAQAVTQVARTFVSAAGLDTNTCANVATPCRHLATAYAATLPNGEIYVLDPANYGSLTITGPVSIEGHGWASIAPAGVGTSAITIDANAGDNINIVGVVLDGTGLASTTGINFNTGGSLTVRDSVIRHFAVGIGFAPNAASELFVSSTLIADNSGNAIAVAPTGAATTTGVLDHVQLVNNGSYGLLVGNSNQTINITVSDSVSANNSAAGIYADPNSGTAHVMVRNSTIASNGVFGLEANTGGTVLVTRSTLIGNATAWQVFNSGNVVSFADNTIDGNGAANTQPPTPLGYH